MHNKIKTYWINLKKRWDLYWFLKTHDCKKHSDRKISYNGWNDDGTERGLSFSSNCADKYTCRVCGHIRIERHQR